MANPSVTANATSGDGSAGAAISPSLSSLTVGNYVVLLVAHNSATAVPTPTGWTLVSGTANTQNPTGTTSDRSIAAFTKLIASATETASLTTSGKYQWTMFEVTNTSGARATSGATGFVTTAGANPTTNSGAGVTTGDLIVAYVITMTASSTFTVGTGYTLVPTAAPSQTNVSNRTETKTATGGGATAAGFGNASTTLWSELVFALAPLSVPTAPGTPTATPGNGTTTLTWADGSNGGASITDHHVYAYDTAGTLLQTIDTGSATASATITLPNGIAYQFKVTATNSVGESAQSASSATTVLSDLYGAVSHVQSTSTGFGTANVTKAFLSNVTAGDFLVAVVGAFVLGCSVSDNLNGNWTRVTEVGTATTLSVCSIWYKFGAKGGATTVTFTGTGSGGMGIIAEYSGVSQTASVQTAFGTFFDAGTSTASWTLSTSTGTPGTGDLGIVGYCDGNQAVATLTTSTANWTARLHNTLTADGYLLDDTVGLVPGTASVALTASTPGPSTSIIATFPVGTPSTDATQLQQAVKRASYW